MTQALPVLVLLPGLDGIGVLHQRFFTALADGFSRIEVIRFPPDRRMSYADMERHVRERLPRDEAFVLIGESFSGPTAIAIAAQAQPPRLLALVLSTTFAMIPSHFMRMLSPLAALLPVHHAPQPAIGHLLFGRWDARGLMPAVRDALGRVSADVLRHRMQEALHADVRNRLAEIRVPTLVLQAEDDALLPAAAASHLAAHIPGARLERVRGPHLLMQAAPEPAAAAVLRFIDALAGRDPAAGSTASPSGTQSASA